MRQIILLMGMLFIIVTPFLVNAAGLKEEYELQERCGKRAAEYFKEQYGSNGILKTKDEMISANYTNHYNKKLNKCFVLVTGANWPTKKDAIRFEFKILLDINEMKLYGNFTKLSNEVQPYPCEVSGKHCNSESEWDSLIKPYMEE